MNTQALTYGPYTPLKQAGDFYYTSGQIGINPVTKQASESIQEQTSQALTNLKEVLGSAKLQITDVVKTTIYLKNINDFEAVNAEYIVCFEEPRPARSCVEVAALPQIGNVELLIEIEAVAYKPATKGEQS